MQTAADSTGSGVRDVTCRVEAAIYRPRYRWSERPLVSGDEAKALSYSCSIYYVEDGTFEDSGWHAERRFDQSLLEAPIAVATVARDLKGDHRRSRREVSREPSHNSVGDVIVNNEN